ncbi:MAG: transferase hexapeptide repeat containing protein [Symploca sp. SIO1C2]|nr:transferase hexapeptide repeat containing protein [Symploca sp. SIO1C2]NER46765.1 transferase hexapeptide repeat containing protein [Symploca sp. SIO1A3]
MLDEAVLEQRLANLEQIVSDLQLKVNSQTATENWLDKLVGSVSDEEIFLQALKYGRELREAEVFYNR